MIKYLLMLFLLTSCAINTSPGNGMKVGRIVKISHSGLFSKTWEFELIRGGLIDGTGSLGQSSHFTIENQEYIELANQAFNEQFEVVVYYREEFISAAWRSEYSRPFFVTHIERNVK